MQHSQVPLYPRNHPVGAGGLRGYPGPVPGAPGGPLPGGSAIAAARAVAMARRQSIARHQSMAAFKRAGVPATAPGGQAGAAALPPYPPTGLAGGAPQPAAVAGAAQPVVAQVEPGAAVNPDEALDEYEAQMLLQRALYELTQKPIIPDPLVFLCACCYLIFIMTALGAGAVYFTNRLKPPPTINPPEETDTTVTFFEVSTKGTTEAPRKWDNSSLNNPLICLVDVLTPPKIAAVNKLIAGKFCNLHFSKQVVDLNAQNELTWAGHRIGSVCGEGCLGGSRR